MILDIPSMVEWWERWQVPWFGASFIIMGPQGLYNGERVHTDPLTKAVIFSWKVRTIYWKKIQRKCDFPLRMLLFAALVNKIMHSSYNNYTYCLTLWFTVLSNYRHTFLHLMCYYSRFCDSSTSQSVSEIRILTEVSEKTDSISVIFWIPERPLWSKPGAATKNTY